MDGIYKNDVIRVNLDGAIGSEQGKVRLAVVIQNNIGNTFSPTTIIIPFTHCRKGVHMPTHALIKRTKTNGLSVDSVLLGEQIRVISEQRIIGKVGTIDDDESKKEIKRAYLANFGE